MIEKIDLNLLQNVRVQENKPLPCIIQFNSKQDAMKYIRNNNIEYYNYFDSIKSVVVDLNMQKIYKSASLESVKYISSITSVCTLVNVAKNIIGVPEGDSYSSNFSTVIIDTGLFPHLDFVINPKTRIIEFIDFVSYKKNLYDDNGHGTFVASLLSGSGIVSGNIYKGIDTNTNLIIIKALDKNGETNAVNIIRAMQWIYDNKVRLNIKIVCMSFGSSVLEKNDPLIEGAESLWDKGVAVVTACGNSGPDAYTIKSPSASSKVISVGAMDDNRHGKLYNSNEFSVAEFSSRGPILGNYKPDIVVSGVNVKSACNYSIYNKFYATMSGTSVATPIVAGVCSRLLKKFPDLTPDLIKNILITNCNPINGDRNAEGFGWLDLHDIFSN